MSWLAAFLTAFGLFLNARKHMACWPVWLAGDAVWLVYGGSTRQWAIVALQLGFLGMNSYGWHQWRKDARKNADL
jgi:nicotinamide mononucleotide transporter